MIWRRFLLLLDFFVCPRRLGLTAWREVGRVDGAERRLKRESPRIGLAAWRGVAK